MPEKTFSKNTKSLPVEILAAILGAVVFLYIYGAKVLNPFDVKFLLAGGDLSQHYLGWELFRQGDWRPMAGLTDRAAFPYSTSVIFTDSIPLFSLIFKLLLIFCNKPFQFFGFWGIFCFAMQGFWAARLIKRRIQITCFCDTITVLILSLLFILSPYFIRRMFWHSALAGQFVILIAIDLFDNSVIYSRFKLTLYWIVLGVLVSSIHIYFIAMCAVILMGCLINRLIFDLKSHDRNFSDIFLDIFCPLFGYIFWSVFTIYFLGGFNSNMSGGAPGIGYYSFNLNGFFNADDGYSRILKQLPFYADGQYEGCAYLGFGALILVGASVIALIIKSIISQGRFLKKIFTPKSVCAICICLVLGLLAASNEITFCDHLLFKIPLPEFINRLYSPFRSSGRLIWPVGYFLILGAIDVLGDIYGHQTGTDPVLPQVKLGTDPVSSQSGTDPTVLQLGTDPTVLMLISLCIVWLSVFDLYPKLSEINRKFDSIAYYRNPVSDCQPFILTDSEGLSLEIDYDILTKICAGEVTGTKPTHMVFLDKDNLSQEDLYGFTLLAIENNMSVNDFYFARYFSNRAGQIAVEYALSQRKDCVFIYTNKDSDKYDVLPFSKYRCNNFTVGIFNED